MINRKCNVAYAIFHRPFNQSMIFHDHFKFEWDNCFWTKFHEDKTDILSGKFGDITMNSDGGEHTQ